MATGHDIITRSMFLYVSVLPSDHELHRAVYSDIRDDAFPEREAAQWPYIVEKIQALTNEPPPPGLAALVGTHARERTRFQYDKEKNEWQRS